MMNDAWRWRLREAINRTGRKRSDVAWSAGIAPVTLSRVPNGVAKEPSLSTVVSIAHEVGITVGWLLNEPEFRVGERARNQLRNAAHVILRLMDNVEA
jgi:transcriptional regulator with XRE-family HTH domain